jgi:hypothetical protein
MSCKLAPDDAHRCAFFQSDGDYQELEWSRIEGGSRNELNSTTLSECGAGVEVQREFCI